MKTCLTCKVSKNPDEFYKDRRAKSGLLSYCKLCTNQANKKFRATEKPGRWKLQDKNSVALRYKKWYKKNILKVREKDKQRVKNNPGNKMFRNAKRRVSKLKAIPKWLTKDQLIEIKQFYLLAQELRWLSQEPLHVDHIIPLQGKDVCGLHVPWNLQILPRSINCSYNNKIK